jgi:hypothetical protein
MEALVNHTTVAPASSPSPVQALATAFGITSGTILKIMATSWSNDRTSYRVSVEQNGKIVIVHKLCQDRETIGINDLLWQLAGGSLWKMRPGYSGAGYILFHANYAAHIARESSSL